MLTGLTILSVIGSPQAAIGKALLVSAAGVGAGAVVAASQSAAKEATAQVGGSMVNEATGGLVSGSDAAAAIRNMSNEELGQLLNMMKIAAPYVAAASR